MKNRQKISWTDELSIGNTDIDKDHNKLLDVYNELVDLIELNKNREEFAKILTKMTNYALQHFKEEENYMQKFSYPKQKEHKKYHRDYMYKVSMYNVNLLGSNPPDPEDIISFLEKWWTNHILHSDTDYENYKAKTQSNIEYKKALNY